MATESVDVCKVCNGSMVDPRILPCAHSFCLKCLESLGESPVCPTCRIKFEIPEGGLKNLKMNEFIKCLSNLTKMSTMCDVCNENEGVKFCVDCKFNYCSTCLKPHDRIPASNGHILVAMKSTNECTNKCTTCEVHLKVMDLYCKDCKVVSCGECVPLNHVGHEMTKVSNHFESVKNNLEDMLMRENKYFEYIIKSHDGIEKLIKENEINAREIKKQIYDFGENIKNAVDSIVNELHRSIDRKLKRKKDADDLIKIKEMKTKVKFKITALNENLNDLNYSNFVKTNDEIVESLQRGFIPGLGKKFNFAVEFKDDKNLADLQKLLKAFKSVQLKQVQVSKSVQTTELEVVPQAKILNENQFIIASINNDIFVSDLNISNTIHVFSYDGLNLVSHYKCDMLENIVDMLTVGDRLYVLGVFIENIIVLKFEDNFNSVPQQIFKLSSQPLFSFVKLSKSYFDASVILLIYKFNIYRISENGDTLDVINLSFGIRDAIQIDDWKYLACLLNSSDICVIDDSGVVIQKFSPSIQDLREPIRLMADNYGFIYVTDNYYNIVTLDFSFGFASMRKCSTLNKSCICYNESRNSFLAFNNSKTLMIFDL